MKASEDLNGHFVSAPILHHIFYFAQPFMVKVDASETSVKKQKQKTTPQTM